jgi:hypothetical protein
MPDALRAANPRGFNERGSGLLERRHPRILREVSARPVAMR